MPAPNGLRSWSIIGRRVFAALALLLIVSCSAEDEQQHGKVDPADFSSFYLWSGVQPHEAMDQAKSVYLLWGELRVNDPSRIVPLRRSVPTAKVEEKWLVIRAERLDWSEGAYAQLLLETKRWQAQGVLTGVQVDFDSTTGGLGHYAEFLSNMRRRLPADLKLSATGLMDWPANASTRDLNAMRDALDEIVIQTYRETTTIPDFARYLAATERFDMPYRVALVEDGEWDEPDQLAADPNFRGFVVFLLGEKFKPDPNRSRQSKTLDQKH